MTNILRKCFRTMYIVLSEVH